ncbi:MAG: Na/Pi cotransporter family protein [Nitrospira sp.]|nr:Na/Pi cotransporter family protein [bacterium]MBL7049646.1 Na/Pi cotransporter family protein [Nitrospira sp.]
MENLDFWKLLAGIGIFIFGMLLLEDALKALSGKTFKRMIALYTKGRIRSIASGTIATAVLQSSSAVSLMVLAFVGAGIMNMVNAIGVIMGANIGTTMTVWIVATLGFKIKISSFALPIIGIGGISIIFLQSIPRGFHACRLLIGFGLLFLGLDYMKSSVETLAIGFDISQIPAYGLWFYVLVGIVLTAVMQASAASIAIVLTGINSGMIDFNTGAAMVIGANVGTTITILLGALGGIPAKKRVAISHLLFNMLTAIVALLAINTLVLIVRMFIDIEQSSVMALAFFHTLFNVIGVIIFFPFIGRLSNALIKLFPDRKTSLSMYISNTPVEVTEAAATALKKEINHLLDECRIYVLRLFRINEKRIFNMSSYIEGKEHRFFANNELYEAIKLLHAEIFAFYSTLQSQKLEEMATKDQVRFIYASRSMMNSIKNFKGIRHNLDEFESSDNVYLNVQYKLFKTRLQELYKSMYHAMEMGELEEQYRTLLKAFVHIEEEDARFIRETMKAVSEKKIQDMQIASLLLVNRLFTQACKMQLHGIKDLFLSVEQIENFDRALDMKEIIEEEKAVSGDDEVIIPTVTG